MGFCRAGAHGLIGTASMHLYSWLLLHIQTGQGLASQKIALGGAAEIQLFS